MKKITIVGLGYVGMPLAIAFANKDFDVTGYDISEEVIKRIREGKYPEMVTNYEIKPIKATTSPEECLPDSDFIIICVPTPLTQDKKPDVTYIKSACETISKYLRKGQVVITESTGYPGTTEEVIKPILEKSGLKAGVDFGLACSPERLDPGNKKYPLEELPKLVAGINKKYGEMARELYSQIIKKVILVSSIKVAETSKVFENTFRNINIAFVNEMALLAEKMGVNIFEVIDAASTKHGGFLAHYPGPGVGGYCIPISPFYLNWKANECGFDSEFIKLADKINSSMPFHVAELIEKSSDKDDTILILGITYKANISDARDTPIKDVVGALKKEGLKIKIFDPYVTIKEFSGIKIEADLEKAIENSDIIVFTVPHDYFKKLENIDKLLRDKIIIDACNFFGSEVGKKYIGLGKPMD
jgi:UDP-N-acetyl-D-glucosamine dehydrogenase